MPEELRIVVSDESSAQPQTQRAAPQISRTGQGPQATISREGVRAPVARRDTPRPPPFPPPVQQKAPSAPPAAQAGTGRAVAAGAVAGAVAAVAVTAVVEVFKAASAAVKRFVSAIETQTAQLAGFSVVAATAQAQTQIRREAALIRRAERIGPQFARAEELRSRFEEATSALWTEILGLLLRLVEALEPAINVLIKAMGLIADFLEEHGDTIARMAGVALKVMFPILFVLEKIFELWDRIFGRDEQQQARDPFAEAFMQLIPLGRRQGDARRGVPPLWPEGVPAPPGV